jgi:hypothetical protein
MRISRIKLGDIEELSLVIIRGFEGEGDGGDTGGSGDGSGDSDSGDGSGDTGDGDGTGGGDDGDGDADDSDLPDDLDGLRKALKAERELRKKAERGQKLTEREKRKLQKAQDDIKAAEDGELNAAKKSAEEATTKAQRLGEKLRQSALERAIMDEARKQKFRDPDDVITQLQRSNFSGIEIDQDDEDPSDIDIDEKSVQKAVKAVATSKPHWLIASGETGPSGSSFNGGKPGSKGDRDKELAERYPSLRGRLGQ